MEKEEGAVVGLGTCIGLLCLFAFLGVLVGQTSVRHLQRVERLESRYWDLKHGTDPDGPVGMAEGRELLRRDVREAVTEALQAERG